MCKVISVSNQKGGVGKTVSCVNLGIGLARSGKKVLLIDADPQGSLTISLGYDEPDKIENTLATILMKVINDEEFAQNACLIRHNEGVDLLPGNIELSGLEISINGVISRETILKQYVDRMREFYDYIIIDCMAFYCDMLKKYDHALYVSGTNLPYGHSKYVHLSYQTINTLDFSKEQLKTRKK